MISEICLGEVFHGILVEVHSILDRAQGCEICEAIVRDR